MLPFADFSMNDGIASNLYRIVESLFLTCRLENNGPAISRVDKAQTRELSGVARPQDLHAHTADEAADQSDSVG